MSMYITHAFIFPCNVLPIYSTQQFCFLQCAPTATPSHVKHLVGDYQITHKIMSRMCPKEEYEKKITFMSINM